MAARKHCASRIAERMSFSRCSHTSFGIPLAPLAYGIDLLGLPDTDPETLARTREMLNRQLHHMGRIIDDLLDVSRITRGKLTVTLDRLDLAALVRQTVEDRRGTLESAGIGVEIDVPNTPLWVTGDSTRLTQLFDNVLDNARKFTSAGGRVSVRLTTDVAARDAVVTVRDTGIGIERLLLPHVFDAFAQAEHRSTEVGAALASAWPWQRD